ncbi:hypothetical protein [Kribbella sp. NPDC051620]|uniref:hypothetical protein n=1 Tax=Kribbella sp. NPDC051620 TaxID=3364120 RepID=UPI0037A49D7F
MTTRTRVAALAATLPLLFGAASCAGTPAAEKQTQPAAPVKAAPPLRLTSATFAPALNKATAKVTSFKAVGQMTTQGQTLDLTVAVTAKPFAISMTMSGAAFDGIMTMIAAKGGVYVSAPGVTPAGKYMVLDLKHDKNPQVRAIGQMLANADPLKQFKSWQPGGQKVKFVGTEKVGDRTLERYQISVVVAKKPIVFDMWLGADKLLYKMAYKFAGLDYVMTMTGYNTVAPIAAPPASKIVKQR